MSNGLARDRRLPFDKSMPALTDRIYPGEDALLGIYVGVSTRPRGG
jgi:hypothetical protein